MSPAKKHKLLFVLSIFLLLPMVLEWNFLTVTNSEIITRQEYYSFGVRHRTTIYKVYTASNSSFKVPKLFYEYTGKEDTIQVMRTKITNRLQSVTAFIYDRPRTFKVGFLNSSLGLISVPAIILGSLLAIIFYNKMNPPGRPRLALFMLILSLSQIVLWLCL